MNGKLTIPVGEDCRTQIRGKRRVAGIKNNKSHCLGVRRELSRTQSALATKEESKLIFLKQRVGELRWIMIARMESESSRGVKCIWPAKIAFSLTPFWSCSPWQTNLFLPPSRGPFAKEHVKFETSWNPTQPEMSWLPWLRHGFQREIQLSGFKINRKCFQGPYQKSVLISHVYKCKELNFTTPKNGKEKVVSADLLWIMVVR